MSLTGLAGDVDERRVLRCARLLQRTAWRITRQKLL